MSEYAIGVIDQLHRHMESNTRLHRSIRLFELFGINPYTSLSDSGLRSNEQILALIIQSKFYNDSKEYKNALLNNTKINPFND